MLFALLDVSDCWSVFVFEVFFWHYRSHKCWLFFLASGFCVWLLLIWFTRKRIMLHSRTGISFPILFISVLRRCLNNYSWTPFLQPSWPFPVLRYDFWTFPLFLWMMWILRRCQCVLICFCYFILEYFDRAVIFFFFFWFSNNSSSIVNIQRRWFDL